MIRREEQMLLNELTTGTLIEIQIEKDKQYNKEDRFEGIVTTSSELEEIRKKVSVPCIFIEALMEQEKPISFDKCKYRVVAIKNLHRYYWAGNVTIRPFRTPSGHLYHAIICNSEAKLLNERDYYRQLIGLRGIAQIAEHTKTINVTVRDISANGIGLVLDKSQMVETAEATNTPILDENYVPKSYDVLGAAKIGKHIRITFTDTNSPLFNENKKRITKFIVNANIVRIIDHASKNGLIIVGCMLDEPNQSLNKYVNAKQREELQRQLRNYKV